MTWKPSTCPGLKDQCVIEIDEKGTAFVAACSVHGTIAERNRYKSIADECAKLSAITEAAMDALPPIPPEPSVLVSFDTTRAVVVETSGFTPAEQIAAESEISKIDSSARIVHK